MWFNPLNTELNPICHLLALIGAHHILHVSRIRVKVNLLSINVDKTHYIQFKTKNKPVVWYCKLYWHMKEHDVYTQHSI